MRIGVAQITTTAGAFDATVERMVEQSRRAAEQGVELLVFPLAALTGVEPLPYADRVSFMADMADAVADLAERLQCTSLVPVLMDVFAQEEFYEVMLIDGGEVRPLRGPALRSSQAAGVSGQAMELPQFSLGDTRFAVALTYDELDDLDDYDYDVDVVLFVSGYPFALDDLNSVLGADLQDTRYVEDACTMDAWLVGAASVGGYGDQVFAGSSFVLAPTGDLAALAPAFEESLMVAELKLNQAGHLAEPLAAELFDAPFHLWQAVSLGIHDYVTKLGRQDVALVLDGTLSSKVLLALATDALGPLHVHALVGASAGAEAPAARELARRLRVDQVDGIAAVAGLDPRDLDDLLLAALAREHGAVALSSLDKTALALGAGVVRAQAALLCPLGDVYRSDVLDMAHVRNSISPLFRKVALGERDCLQLRMPDGTPWLIQSEADVMSVDEILLGYVEYDRSLAGLSSEDVAKHDVVDAVLHAERMAEAWRRAQPPVLAMSTHTLDDARFPLGVEWHDSRLAADLAFGIEPTAAPAPEPAERDDDAQERTTERHSRSSVDLQGTLALLRDLAEQGGFSVEGIELSQAGEGPDPKESGGGSPRWMFPFSEN